MESTLQTASDIFCTVLGKGTTSPIPMIQDAWQIFSKKGIRTVFISVGSSSSSSADLEIAESIGCPLHAVILCEEQGVAWQEVTAILKSRRRDPAQHTPPFSEGADQRWMLAKNVRVLNKLPFWNAGTMALDASGGSIATDTWVSIIKGMCKDMKLPEEQIRLDILKVDLNNAGLERSVLMSVMDAGFRPCILAVRWTEVPTTNLATAHTAGFLQMMGYSLVARLNNAFLYFYTDKDLFQICSWEDTMLDNPLAKEIIGAVAPPAAAAETPAAAETSSSTAEGEAS